MIFEERDYSSKTKIYVLLVVGFFPVEDLFWLVTKSSANMPKLHFTILPYLAYILENFPKYTDYRTDIFWLDPF